MTGNHRMTVSYAEIARLGVHALRGLGYSFSVAERSAHVLAVTEAVTGQGLDYLVREERRITSSSGSAASLAIVDGGVMRLDGRRKTLLELSPFIGDLVAADARRRGSTVLSVENCHGVPFIADLALRARDAGLAMTMLYREGDGDLCGKVLIDGEEIEGTALADPASAAETADAWVKQAAGAPAGEFDLLCIAGNSEEMTALYRATDGEVAGMAWQGAAAWSGKLDAAIKGHIMADPAAFAFFTQCVARIWAPTSERSRGQQG